MGSYLNALILIIVLCIIYKPLVPVQAYDGETYRVLNEKNKQMAADKLARLRNKLHRLVKSFTEANPNSPLANRLKKKFKGVLSENGPGNSYTSYTVNKGEHMYMCLRSKEEAELVDDNTLMFVAIHELAHVMSIGIGHRREFVENFKTLLKFAQEREYYTYQPFHIKPKKYCGTTISSVPL